MIISLHLQFIELSYTVNKRISISIIEYKEYLLFMVTNDCGRLVT